MASMTFLEQLHALHGALHLSHIPAALPGREEQHASLRDFLSTHVSESRGGSLYVSGAPGTGKTASVEHVVHQLYGQRFHADAAVGSSAAVSAASSGPKSKTKLLSKLCASSPPARSTSASAGTGPLVVYTNAMAFASKPSALYPRLLAQLRGLTLEEEMALPSAMACMEELQQMFCPATAAAVAPVPLKASSAANKTKSGSAKKKSGRTGDDDEDASHSANGGAASRMTLVVLDEVDALLRGPNAAVLYHLLEWPARPHSRLVVVAISNTINLLEQRLPELSRRNALPQTLLFTTYDAAQLKRIAQERCDSIYPPEVAVPVAPAAPAVPAPAPEVAPARSPKKGSAPSTPAKSPKPSASAAASISIASLSASKPAPAPVLRSSPRTVPRSGSGRADVVVRSIRSRKRKQGEEEEEEEKTSTTEDEATTLSAAAGVDADGDHSVVSIHHVPLRIDTPSILEEAENVDPVEADADRCVTPKKKRARGAVLPRDSSAEAASASGVAAASASPTASPAASSCPSSSPRCSPSLSPTPSVHIQPSTRSRPFFSDHALDFLCLKVSKGSGDLRKVLEVMRKCLDGLLVEVETIQIIARDRVGAAAAGVEQTPSIPEDAEAAEASSPSSSSWSASALPSDHPSLQVSLPLMHGMVVSCMGGAGEQMGLLRSLPVQQKVLLSIGALLCHLHGGKEQLHAFPKYYARFSAHFKLEPLRGADFADLLAALAAHRLIKLERPAVRRRAGGAMGSGGGGSGRSAPASGGGSGRNSKALGGASGALGAIQVNVSLESLTAAFEGDPLMERLLSKGKALATSILAASRAASEIPHEDYVLRNVEDP